MSHRYVLNSRSEASAGPHRDRSEGFFVGCDHERHRAEPYCEHRPIRVPLSRGKVTLGEEEPGAGVLGRPEVEELLPFRTALPDRGAEISTLTEPASERTHHDAAIGEEGRDTDHPVEHPEQPCERFLEVQALNDRAARASRAHTASSPGAWTGVTELCDDPVIADPPSLSDVRARLASLRDQGAAKGEVAPAGAATPEQLDAMRETMEILSDPTMLMRVRAGRAAVASGDVVALEEPAGGLPPTSDGGWRVALTGPVARELAQRDEPSASAVRELLRALAARPTERGRALGMGLVGVWSAHGESQRVLYAMHEGQRLLTVLSVDDR